MCSVGARLAFVPEFHLRSKVQPNSDKKAGQDVNTRGKKHFSSDVFVFVLM